MKIVIYHSVIVADIHVDPILLFCYYLGQLAVIFAIQVVQVSFYINFIYF